MKPEPWWHLALCLAPRLGWGYDRGSAQPQLFLYWRGWGGVWVNPEVALSLLVVPAGPRGSQGQAQAPLDCLVGLPLSLHPGALILWDGDIRRVIILRIEGWIRRQGKNRSEKQGGQALLKKRLGAEKGWGEGQVPARRLFCPTSRSGPRLPEGQAGKAL